MGVPDILKEIEKLNPRRVAMLHNLLKASRLDSSLTRRYSIVLQWNEPDENDPTGGYTAIVPSLPPVISEGDTRDEALANVREAIECYLESLLLIGESIPDSDENGECLVEVTV